MDRRSLLKIAAATAGQTIFARNAISQTTAHRKIACAFRSDQLARYSSRIWKLPAVEIEDWLDPTFPERAQSAVPVIQQALKGYRGRILLSGPFIDLNAGSAEHLIQKATRQRFDECYQFARAIGAREIIFLSSYIPIINVTFYDQGWLSNSIGFWRSYLDSGDPHIIISFCNTFEYHPNLMLQLLEQAARPNFRLAFDLGHFLVYGHELFRNGWAPRRATRPVFTFTATTVKSIRTKNLTGAC